MSRRARDIAAGFIAGLAALGAGFLAALVLAVSSQESDIETAVGPDGTETAALAERLPEWYRVGSWLFLEGHRVDVSVEVGGVLGGAPEIEEYAETLLPAVPELQLLPPVLLGGAGALVALRRPRSGPVDAALAGASVVAGYLPGVAGIAAVATFEATVLGELASLEIGVGVGQAVLAGLAYPLVFGTAGGVIVSGLARAAPADR